MSVLDRANALPLMLIPGQAAAAERVGTSTSVEAPMPVRVDPLSLSGPGAQVPAMLHPLVRHWSTTRRVTVHTVVAGKPHITQVPLTDWHQEAVVDGGGNPVMVPDDDQVGTLPPREWLHLQVRSWQAQLGHHGVVPTVHRAPVDRSSGAQVRGQLRQLLPTLLRLRDGAGIWTYAFLHSAEDIGRRYLIAAQAGLLGYERPQDRSLDPLADEVERRFGEPPRARAMEWNANYLLTHLDTACDRNLGIAAFAAELHALDAELGRVLGYTPDQEWLGRCPAFLADADDEVRRPCGAGLWQDNTAFTAQVRCPRCHTVWDTRGPGAAYTAREIRRVWPVDRRRRYNVDEINRLVPPKCPGCGNRVRIGWKDVTGSRDKRRWWQPTGSSCPGGCDDAGRVV